MRGSSTVLESLPSMICELGRVDSAANTGGGLCWDHRYLFQ